MASLSISQKLTAKEEEGQYTLRLRIGDVKLKRSFSSWDDLKKHKELVKLLARWNSINKSWIIKDYIKDVS